MCWGQPWAFHSSIFSVEIFFWLSEPGFFSRTTSFTLHWELNPKMYLYISIFIWIMNYVLQPVECSPLSEWFVFDISLCVGFAGVGGWLQNNFLTWEYLHKFAIIPTRLWPTQTSPLARIHHSSRFSQYARRAELNMRTALQRIAASIFVSEYSRQNIINIWRHPGTCLNILSNTCAFAI